MEKDVQNDPTGSEIKAAIDVGVHEYAKRNGRYPTHVYLGKAYYRSFIDEIEEELRLIGGPIYLRDQHINPPPGVPEWKGMKIYDVANDEHHISFCCAGPWT